MNNIRFWNMCTDKIRIPLWNLEYQMQLSEYLEYNTMSHRPSSSWTNLRQKDLFLNFNWRFGFVSLCKSADMQVDISNARMSFSWWPDGHQNGEIHSWIPLLLVIRIMSGFADQEQGPFLSSNWEFPPEDCPPQKSSRASQLQCSNDIQGGWKVMRTNADFSLSMK
jgi:hypothetical protein